MTVSIARLLIVSALSHALWAGCIPIEGDHIHAADLAKIVPIFARLDTNETIGLAPAPGARRVISAPELSRIAARYNLRLSQAFEVCLEQAVAPLTGDQVVRALAAAPGLDGAQITLVDYDKAPMPHGTLEFARPTLAVPVGVAPDTVLTWRGKMRYGAARSVLFWVRFRASTNCRRVVAARPIRTGELIDAGRLKIDSSPQSPFASHGIADVSKAAGRLARRSIAAGQIIRSEMLGIPNEIEPGEIVSVEVRADAARLRLDATAESGGRAGDTIVLRNPNSGKRFPAVVDGKDRAVLQIGRKIQNAKPKTISERDGSAGLVPGAALR